MANINIDMTYNTACCISDCIKSAIESASEGKTVLSLPCDSNEQQIEILKEYDDFLDEIIINTEWD